MRGPENDEMTLNAIAYGIAGLRLRLAQIRLGLVLERRYNPAQPRWPSGRPDGGRWSGGSGAVWTGVAGHRGGRLLLSQTIDADGTSIATAINDGDRDYDWDERHLVIGPDGARTVFETEGHTQTIREGETGEILSRSTWGPHGPEPDAVLQNARAPTGRSDPLAAAARALRKTREAAAAAGAALYNWFGFGGETEGGGKTEGGIPVASFRAQEDAAGSSLVTDYVGTSTRKEITQACPEATTVQSLTDMAARETGDRNAYPSPAVYGTYVHSKLRDKIRELRNPDLVAEVSIAKSQA